jgi:signal transduction histidine kinase
MIDTGKPRFGRDGAFNGFVGSMVEIEDQKAAENKLRSLNDRLEEQVVLRTQELEASLDKARTDAREKRALEEAVLHSQKIQTLGQLTGGIAHDFNNLLTPILGGLQLVLAMLKEPTLRPLLEGAVASAHRGAELTKRLLTFSRMHKLEIRPVQPRLMLLGMNDLLQRTLGPLVQVELEIEEGEVLVAADQTQLEMAVLNLAINARDAMPDGGTVKIKTIRSILNDDKELAPGEYVQIRVTDHGKGMTPEVAAKAFDPFFTTKQPGAGTGLGLSMVYALAKQCGGTVKLETAIERGTTVRLFLPVIQGSLVDQKDRPAKSVQHRLEGAPKCTVFASVPLH